MRPHPPSYAANAASYSCHASPTSRALAPTTDHCSPPAPSSQHCAQSIGPATDAALPSMCVIPTARFVRGCAAGVRPKQRPSTVTVRRQRSASGRGLDVLAAAIVTVLCMLAGVVGVYPLC